MTVHWTEAALADLQAIEAHIRRHSRQYAQGMVETDFRLYRTTIVSATYRADEMAAEMAEDGPGLCRGQAARALAPSDRGENLDGRDAGNKEGVSRLRL